MGKNGQLIVGLDIGTTKVCVVAGEAREEGLEFIGIGSHPSRGIREGVVINVEETVESIKRAVEDAEIMANCRISSVYAGVSGSHIKSFNSHGVIGIKEKEVSSRDINKVIEAAKAVAIPQDREVFHVLPQEFYVDDQGGINNPLGMSGVRLEARVHIITGAAAVAQNIVKCTNKTGLEVKEIVCQPLASAEAVVSPEEKELGVAVIDIGGGTTEVALFSQGSVKHTAVLPLGGQHITSDISIGLRTAAPEAERIKKKFGAALGSMADLADTVEVSGLGERSSRIVARKLLVEIIQARAEEILELAQREVARSGFDKVLAAGIVLTGGAAILNGMTDLAEIVFGLPCRLGLPSKTGGLVDEVLSPIYAGGVGLVLYGYRKDYSSSFKAEEVPMLKRMTHRMRDWLAQL